VSAVEDGRRGFSAWLHRLGASRGDIAGGLTAAVVLLAVEGSYGLIAFSRLGPDQAQIGFVLGVFSAALASFVSLLAGSRGPMLSGGSAALALLIPSLIAALVADARFVGPDGQPLIALLLSYAALGVIVAGALQVLIAVVRLGGLVRYVPYPVHAGYMNGTAVLMILAMLPHLLGLAPGQGIADWPATQPFALAVGLVAFGIAVKPPRFSRRVPAYLLALGCATLLHHLLALTPGVRLLGPLFAPPEFTWPSVAVLEPVLVHVGDGLLTSKLIVLLQFAVAVAFVSSLQTALAGSTVDELIHRRHPRGREMLAQGAANIAIGALGGVPAAGAVGKTKLSLDAGAHGGASRVFYALGLVVALVVGLRYMRIVPMAAIAGVFCAVAVSLVDAWSRTATAVMWRQTMKWRVPRALGINYAVMMVVGLIAIVVSLPVAIGVGMLIAVLMFIKSNSKPPVRQVAHADIRHSRKIRPQTEAELLQAQGRRIALIELDGALFFGTAEAADHQIEKLVRVSDFIVIDFERVSEVDASGARVLLQAADVVRRNGKTLLLAGLRTRDGRTHMIRDMDVHGRIQETQFFADADRALEYAEDKLLARLEHAPVEATALTLEQTLLGGGLTGEERATLAEMLTERRFRKGERVFASGEAGDQMYVLLQGQIGIWLPTRDPNHEGRRLVSYAPGVVFGEMALLAGVARSADAIAESDALVLELTRESYLRLMSEYPTLLGKLLLNISLLLASRVRALTDELEAAQAIR
jgi:sulfate permease, SulP family